MAKYFKELRLEQLDDLLKEHGNLAKATRPQRGWMRTIRESFGMSAEQLARRVGVSRSTVQAMERREAGNNITLESLDKLAHGLGCRVVYAVIPEEGKTFSGVVLDRATALAREQLDKVSHTMELEAQGLSPEKKKRQLERLINEYLSGSLRKLWQ